MALAFEVSVTGIHARPHPVPLPQGEGETFSGFGDDQSVTFLSAARDRSLSWAVTIQLDRVAQPNLAVLGGNLPPSLERRTRSPFCAALVVYFMRICEIDHLVWRAGSPPARASCPCHPYFH